MAQESRTLPVASTTATLTPVRKPGSRPSVVRLPAGAASRRSPRFLANTSTASSSARCRSRMRASTDAEIISLTRHAPPPPPRGGGEPRRCRGWGGHVDAQRLGDHGLVVGVVATVHLDCELL